MTAVATVDTWGAIIILTVVGVIFVVDGVRNLISDRARQTAPLVDGTRQAPAPRPVPVEPGMFSAADITYRKEATTRQSNTSAAETIETLTYPHLYSRVGTRR